MAIEVITKGTRMSTLKDILEQRGMPCCGGCGMRMKMMEGTCPDCGVNYGLSMGAKNAPGMSEEKEEEPTADFKLDKLGRKIKASKIVFNQGEDDSTKRVQENMKTTYKDMITAYSAMRVESLQLEDEINEVLSKDAAAGEWISDFVHSDNPKFAGKSKEKRKQMALAAYYAKQKNEEVEIDEVAAWNPINHIPKENQNKAIKTAAKDVKRGSYADRAALLKAGGVKKEEVVDESRGFRGVDGRRDREDDEGYSRTKEADDAHNRAIDAAAKARALAAKAPKNTNEEVDESTVPAHMKGKQKPYVSSSGGDHEVLGNVGQVKATFTQKEHGKEAKAKAIAHLKKNYDTYMKEEIELDEAEYKISTAQMGHAGKTTIKHIKNPDVTQRMAAHDVKSYADRIALLKDAKRKGNLKEDDMQESAFDWKNNPKETKDKTKTSTYHDVKKISTGTVYTKQFDKDGTSKGTGGDAAAKAENAPKRGRGRPKKDKFAESVEILMSLSEEQFDSMMEDGFDTFFEAYEQLDELSKTTLGSYAKKASLDSVMRMGKAATDGDHKEAEKAGKRYGNVVKAIDKLTK
jgi:hypothetical protein